MRAARGEVGPVRITAAIIALNEETNIEACLASLAWADERLVVDGGSTDATVILAEQTGARVVSRRFDSFPSQRNHALDQVRTEWVLFVDADERVEAALVDEILRVTASPACHCEEPEGLRPFPTDGDRAPVMLREQVVEGSWEGGPKHPSTELRTRLEGGPGANVEGDPAAGTGSPVCRGPAGFWVPRKNFMLGRWVRHAGWWPDYQLRLFRPDAGRYDEAQDPHEVPLLRGEAAYLQEPLVHHNYRSVREMFARQDRYARREAAKLAQSGVRPRLRSFASGPVREFWRRYVSLEGYRDGGLGLLLGGLMAWYEWRVRVHLLRGH